MTKALYFFSLGWITILFLSNSPIAAQNNWFEKAKDSVDGRFSQGVATDGVFWYFSSNRGLYKTDSNFNMLIEKDGTQNPIPGFLQDQGYNHIGDIAYFVGKLYAPIEDLSYVKPIVGIYDADSLNFTGEFIQVPQSHFPWIAVDPRTSYFYSSEFNGVNKLFVYELYVWDGDKYFDLIDEVTLNLTLARVQGGAFLGDFLYLACDNGDYVYEVDISSGSVRYIFNVPSDPEMEGIEAYELDSGILHFVAETGGSTNIFYHYDKILPHDVRVSSIISPEPKMPIWGKITPVATVQNIGTNTEQAFNVTCVIDTTGVEIYRDTQILSSITSLDILSISFATLVPSEAIVYNLIFFTELSSDLNTNNDTLRFNMEASNTIDDFEFGVERWNLDSGWELNIGRNNTLGIATTPRPYQNNTDSPLTYLQPFDLSSFDLADSINLSLWTKNRLEEDIDFLYVEASADGNNWSQLGHFTGRQENWIQTFHSLSSFSGPGNDNIHFRFRLVTDSSGTDSGVRIDDVGIFFSIIKFIAVHPGDVNNICIPEVFSLDQNYPNPFNPRTTFRFALPEDQHVTLTVYNLLGQIIIETMNDHPYDAGIHTITLDTSHFSSGIYFYRIQAGKWSATRKMILMK